MCCLKREIWKAGIAVAGMLLLLVFMVWIPVSAVGAYEGTSGLATPLAGTAQTTPTEDATVGALNKEKLEQEVKQLKNQNEPDLLGWLRTNASILLSTLVVVIGALIGLFRWLGDRLSEREKRAEERFQSIVVGLGDEKEGAKIGAAILLRTFLRPGHEQFYTQTFDLAVANLRLRRNSTPPEDPDGISHPAEDTNTLLPLTSLRQALIVVFTEAFPLVRDSNSGGKEEAVQSLDATGIRLDNAYLGGADLKQVWMPQASLRKVDLIAANLWTTDLRGANLSDTSLYGTVLIKADLSNAILRETNLENALSVKDASLRGVKGLTKEQLEVCKANGAIIDEDSTASSSQSPVSPSPSSQSNDAQAQSIPSAQGSNPTPDTDGSNAASSEPGLQS